MTIRTCECKLAAHAPKLVVLTGGPGAGKTAVLELVHRAMCVHVGVLPEAAGIVFGGGFPRRDTPLARAMAQRAIFHVQRSLEELALGDRSLAVVLCDRGTVDGLAYWPGDEASFWALGGNTREAEIARYDAVIHLATPPAGMGYDNSNRLRIETAEQAGRVDQRIREAWSTHARRVVIESEADFLHKAARAVDAIRAELPACCRVHPVPEVDGPRPPRST